MPAWLRYWRIVVLRIFELLSRVRGSGWQQRKRILRGKPLSRLPLSVLKIVGPFVGHR